MCICMSELVFIASRSFCYFVSLFSVLHLNKEECNHLTLRLGLLVMTTVTVRPKCSLCEVTMFVVTTGAGKRQVKAGRGRSSRVGAKVHDGKQAQGWAEWSGQARVKKKQEDEIKRGWEKTGQTLVSLTN